MKNKKKRTPRAQNYCRLFYLNNIVEIAPLVIIRPHNAIRVEETRRTEALSSDLIPPIFKKKQKERDLEKREG